MNLRHVLFGLTFATTAVIAANEPVSLRVSPAVSMAPANLAIEARVEPDIHNRAIEIVADSGTYYRSSTIPLEGDRAPKTTAFHYLSLPPGEYEVVATLLIADGTHKAEARTHVSVIGQSSPH